jgi:hypothetical protein
MDEMDRSPMCRVIENVILDSLMWVSAGQFSQRLNWTDAAIIRGDVRRSIRSHKGYGEAKVNVFL